MSDRNISGGFRGEPKTVRQWIDRATADPKMRRQAEKEVARLMRKSLRLRVAEWLGTRLPFRWAPIWLNNRLADWMWHTPGFNVAVGRRESAPPNTEPQ